ncbi:MAG: DsbA family protein [Acidimicrobiales bacterium]
MTKITDPDAPGPSSFAVTWDYRCPFARNVHEHILAGLAAGAPWDVQFVPFNLDQTHVAEGDAAVWDVPEQYPGLLAGEVGIVVRDHLPERFLAVHGALFRARHDDGSDLRDREVLARVLDSAGADAGAVLDEVDKGWPLQVYRKAHEAAVDGHQVFGVPTFIAGDRAVFVRLMTRPAGDGALAVATIDRILGLISSAPEINELKHTSIAR